MVKSSFLSILHLTQTLQDRELWRTGRKPWGEEKEMDIDSGNM